MRASIETEDIHRGAEPGDVPRDAAARISRRPVLASLSFDQQGHTNGQHRNAQARAWTSTFSWFVPGKAGDHDLKFGFQYLYAPQRC